MLLAGERVHAVFIGWKSKRRERMVTLLDREVGRMKEMWDDTNHLALDRLNRLKGEYSNSEAFAT